MSVERLSRAITAAGSGRIIVVRGSRGEGHLVLAASTSALPQMLFLIRHGSGLVYAPMTSRTADRLGLPVMATADSAVDLCMTVTVDHFSTATGISARDRWATVHALADRRTQPSDLRRPGHIMPIRVQADGVKGRSGWPEATVGLLMLARAGEVGVATELMGEDCAHLSGSLVERFATAHDLAFLPVDDLLDAAGDPHRH